jgi:hypothetical protein
MISPPLVWSFWRIASDPTCAVCRRSRQTNLVIVERWSRWIVICSSDPYSHLRSHFPLRDSVAEWML